VVSHRVGNLRTHDHGLGWAMKRAGGRTHGRGQDNSTGLAKLTGTRMQRAARVPPRAKVVRVAR
jgi:hypothetical protein